MGAGLPMRTSGPSGMGMGGVVREEGRGGGLEEDLAEWPEPCLFLAVPWRSSSSLLSISAVAMILPSLKAA